MPLSALRQAAYIRQFRRQHRPRLGILMETEVCQFDARLPRGRRAAFFGQCAAVGKNRSKADPNRPLAAPALAGLRGRYAQTAADAERLHFIGASNVHVCGNSKYDITPSETTHACAAAFKQRNCNRAVVVCASTREHKGVDEAALLREAGRADRGDALLVIVPRHPERFQTAFLFGAATRASKCKRSDNQPVAADTQVWIGDSMANRSAIIWPPILLLSVAARWTGCQNIIELIACGVPHICSGPSIYNFAAACRGALEAGVARQVFSAR